MVEVLAPPWAEGHHKPPPYPSNCSFRKNFGIGEQEEQRKQAAFHVIKTEYKLLGPMSFAEKTVCAFFLALVVLWFTREPGFFRGWGDVAFSDANGTV